MNLDQIGLAAPPMVRTALTTPNPANAVQDHLRDIGLAPLFGMDGVYITGSQVWRTALGLPLDDAADVDVMLVGTYLHEVDELRDAIIAKLALADSSYPTAPSMSGDRDAAIMPGQKYVMPSGRVMDIWGMENLHLALSQYPEHSHASSRMAWDCQHGCLIMYPNTAAVTAEASAPTPKAVESPEPLPDPEPCLLPWEAVPLELAA